MTDPMVRVSDLHTGDTLLVHGKSFISSLIMALDGSEVSHAALYYDTAAQMVAEATGPGLKTRELAESLREAEFALVYRLKTSVASSALSMDPVFAVARGYLAKHEVYGVGQLVLAGILCITRKAVPGPLGFLTREVLDHAAESLNQLISGPGEPMICSEFVYRCHDEAMPEPNDDYAIKIVGLERMPAAFDGPTAKAAPTRFHPDSPLALALASKRTVAAVPKSTAALPDKAKLEQVLGQLESDLATKARSLGSRATSPVPNLTDSADRFMAAYVAVRRTARSLGTTTATVAKAIPTTQPELANEFAKAVADFVTPRDLHDSPSLQRLGRLSLA
jgi:hypothetical protein